MNAILKKDTIYLLNQPHEGDCSLNQDELCTSIDELFNKTDGILPGDITANKIDDPEVVFDDDGENNDNDHHVIEERLVLFFFNLKNN